MLTVFKISSSLKSKENWIQNTTSSKWKTASKETKSSNLARIKSMKTAWSKRETQTSSLKCKKTTRTVRKRKILTCSEMLLTLVLCLPKLSRLVPRLSEARTSKISRTQPLTSPTPPTLWQQLSQASTRSKMPFKLFEKTQNSSKAQRSFLKRG